MSLVNSVKLVGRVGNDVEVKTFDNGSTKVSFSLATDESYKDTKGEKVDNTLWHDLEAWGTTGDLIQKMVKKGQQLVVEGTLRYSISEKEDKKIKYTSIRIESFLIVSNSNDKKTE